MAPKHDFIITDRTDITYEQFRIESSWVDRRLVLKNRDDIKGYFILGDDLITFIQGTLYWIPMKNLAKRDEAVDGLCKYGRTKIEGESLRLFADLLKHWIATFSCAPEEVCLIKGYHFYVREWEHYEECTYKTADVVASLEKALEYVSLAIDNNYIIIHSGI